MADSIVPQIVYNPGTGPQTLSFTYPPTKKPGSTLERVAVRTDSDTLSGLRQSFFERVDQFWTLDMPLQGGSFDYYPDSTVASYTSFTLEDTQWNPKFAYIGMVSFTMRFRLLIT